MKIEMEQKDVERLLAIESKLTSDYIKLRKEFLSFKDIVTEWYKQDLMDIDKLKEELKRLKT